MEQKETRSDGRIRRAQGRPTQDEESADYHKHRNCEEGQRREKKAIRENNAHRGHYGQADEWLTRTTQQFHRPLFVHFAGPTQALLELSSAKIEEAARVTPNAGSV